jgi:hypothetical protein
MSEKCPSGPIWVGSPRTVWAIGGLEGVEELTGGVTVRVGSVWIPAAAQVADLRR